MTNMVLIMSEGTVHVNVPLMPTNVFMKLKICFLPTEKNVKKGKKDKKGKKSVSTYNGSFH